MDFRSFHHWTLASCRIYYSSVFYPTAAFYFQIYLAICRCSHSKPSNSANNLSDLWISLLFFKRVFFCKMIDSTFSRLSAADLMASIWIWKVLFTCVLFSGLICSFRKDILSSIICCRIVWTNVAVVYSFVWYGDGLRSPPSYHL